MTPVSDKRRIEALDILRGISIFGVLASDMIGLSSPEHHFGPGLMWTDPASRAVAFLLDVLVSEKFLTLFSVLFGIGLAIQFERSMKYGVTSLAFYWRRFAGLLLMGIVHGLFVWPGDILTTYAVFGALLLLFRNRTQKTVLSWAVGLQILMFLASLAAWLYGGKRLPVPGELEARVALFGQGTWEAIQQARVGDYMERHVGSLPLLLPFIFPRFLFGLWLWRTGFLHSLSDRKPLLRRICLGGIAIGIAGEATTAMLAQGDMGPLRVICIPLLACGYGCGIALFASGGFWPRLRRALAAVGRASLSNYLFQRVLCTTLFYSYGFGLYGKVGPLAGLGITSLIFVVQLLLTALWMRHFQYGPLEWAWRSFSYWRLQQMRARAI